MQCNISIMIFRQDILHDENVHLKQLIKQGKCPLVNIVSNSSIGHNIWMGVWGKMFDITLQLLKVLFKKTYFTLLIHSIFSMKGKSEGESA